MPQTKIVFFDIDGTLIDMQAKKITPKMLETLHRLQDRGIKICIATGRSPMVLPKIDGVAFDAYLTFNGSLCRPEDQTKEVIDQIYKSSSFTIFIGSNRRNQDRPMAPTPT